jgi:hypothetical protein
MSVVCLSSETAELPNIALNANGNGMADGTRVNPWVNVHRSTNDAAGYDRRRRDVRRGMG